MWFFFLFLFFLHLSPFKHFDYYSETLFDNFFGEAIVVAVRKCKMISPREAKLRAIQVALDEAIIYGWAHLIIESDCKTAIEALSKASPPLDWSWWSVFYHILGICNFFINVEFCWIIREGNRPADLISQLALNDSCIGTFQPHEISTAINVFIQDDYEWMN